MILSVRQTDTNETQTSLTAYGENESEVNSMKTMERAEISRDCSGLPPEDLAFINGIVQMLAAMYCRLHPIPAEPTPEPKKEEENA